jgi:hypothetical protein
MPLARQLNAYQRTHRILPPVIALGCGGGEIEVRIVAEPPNGTVFFIPVFFHEICRLQQIDPDDQNRCNRWREAIAGTPSMVAGDYVYLARWPDGVIRRGKLSFDGVESGKTVTLQKP